MNLESINFEKFKKKKLVSMSEITGGCSAGLSSGNEDCDTGCDDAPDKCSDNGDGTGCGDSSACI